MMTKRELELKLDELYREWQRYENLVAETCNSNHWYYEDRVSEIQGEIDQLENQLDQMMS